MKTIMKFNIRLWVLLCLPFLIASCDHNVHEDKEDYGLSVRLTWQDEADRGTDVADVKLWIFNADNGSLVIEKQYSSGLEMASQRFKLPVGNYHILSAVNLTDPFTIGDATQALTDWNNIQIGLTNHVGVTHNAYFGVTDAKVTDEAGYYVVENPVKNVLSELTIIIENAPNGMEMNGTVTDASTCVFATQKDSDGAFGLPSLVAMETALPTIKATDSALKSDIIRLMPTIQGNSSSHIYLCLKSTAGIVQEFDITAPVMKVGGKYELRLNYNEMQPKMNLDASINNWTDRTSEVEIK